jgi:uncharacterized protein YaiL (DUF2058 family)
MALAKTIEKLKKYYERLEAGKTGKIKASHVERVIDKLTARENSLREELAAAGKPSKKERLEQKLVATQEQIERARWLLEKIN